MNSLGLSMGDYINSIELLDRIHFKIFELCLAARVQGCDYGSVNAVLMSLDNELGGC